MTSLRHSDFSRPRGFFTCSSSKICQAETWPMNLPPLRNFAAPWALARGRPASSVFLSPAALAALALASSAAFFPQPSLGQPAQPAHAISAARAVYDNDQLFEQLSGAARSRAERKFGKKRPVGTKAGPAASGSASS